MDQSILDALTKSLPTMQMDALREELKKGAQYGSLNKLIEERAADNTKLRAEVSRLEKELKAHADLDAKARVVEAGIRELEVEKLKMKVKCEEEKFAAVRDLAYAAFRNPTVTKSFNRHVGVPNGGYTNVVNESESTTAE